MRFTLYFFFLYATITAQPYPKDYFRSPLDIPLQLSGNFGELRSNHFHAGFDFRTQQKEGFNVYAAAEGYVSRIRISPFGYGKALYITHPNGYTTVYGHLKYMAPKIEKFLKAKQYEKQAFDVDLALTPEELTVNKGEMVAISGNTGGSEGPHLHFEIRDTKTENVINPMYFGFDVLLPDSKRPVITNLVVYPLDANSVVNKSSAPIVMDLEPNGEGQYISEKVFASGRIGIGISTYDMDSNSFNRNGIFEADAYLNGSHSFGFKFDTYHFDESRYINALIDYPRFKKTSQRVQKLFMLTKYPLSIIHPDENNGIITVSPNVAGAFRVEVADFSGNKSIVSVPIEYSAAAALTPPENVQTPYYVEPSKDYNFEKANMGVFFPAGSFYDPFYLDFDVVGNQLLLNNKNVAVHNAFTISITDSAIDEKQREKTFIAMVTGKKVTYNATTRKGDVFNAKVKALGTYALAKDTIAPTISIGKSIEGKSLNAQKSLSLVIKDDLSGIKEYNGYLNGKWVLFEYDYKSRRITHNLNDGHLVDGRNELKVVVSDNVGNSAIFETHFFRSK